MTVDRLAHLAVIAQQVSVAKLKLSGLRDRAVADILPGAPRVADDVSAVLDLLLRELREAK